MSEIFGLSGCCPSAVTWWKFHGAASKGLDSADFSPFFFYLEEGQTVVLLDQHAP